MEKRPSALIREMLVLSYVQKWIEAEIEQFEKLEHSHHLIAYADNIHNEVHNEIVSLKLELKNQECHIIQSSVKETTIDVEYRYQNYIQSANFHKSSLIADAKVKFKKVQTKR